MKLSIVVPAYNEEAFISQCLEAITKETKASSNHEIEIIVVNNASTDRTKTIALSFPGVIVVDELRRGLPMARQAGFNASKGELVANVDADTIMPSGWIGKVIKEFAENNNLAALSGPYIYYDRSWIANASIWVYYYLGYLIHLFNQYVFKIGAMLQGGNFVLRRTSLEKVGGFDTNIEFYGEDTDIARRIQKVGIVKFSFSLAMPTSARRLSKEGILMTCIKYVFNYFWIIFFKKPYKYRYTYVGQVKDSDNKHTDG